MENPQRLNVQSHPEKLEAQWGVGFVDGEGCFYVGINPHPEMSCQYQVLPEFTVVQHQRDVQLLHALKRFFGCGVVRHNHGDRMAYRVRGLNHLTERIVPFFEKHSLKSRKRVDFARFRSEEHTSELQSQSNLVCRLLLEKKKRTDDATPCSAQS